MKKFLSVIICAVILFVILVTSFAVNLSHNTKLKAQEQTIAQLQNQVNGTDSNKKQINKIDKLKKYDSERKAKDDKLVEEFFAKILTWLSYAEYTANREDVINTYNLKGDSNFIDMFLPDVPNMENEGEESYNIIDKYGYNFHYENMESYLTDISGSKYYYSTEVVASTRASNGGVSHTTILAEYAVDKNGNLSDFKGYVVKIE